MVKPRTSLSETLELENLKYTILFVDDEQQVLSALARTFRKSAYQVITASSAGEAWKMLKDHSVHVMVTDYRMPGVNGVELLKRVKLVYPDTIRIMLTGYADTQSVMEAVNQGAVYKFIAKPWNDDELRLAIRLALTQYNLIAENKKLKTDRTEQVKNIDKLSKFINQSRLADKMLESRLIRKQDVVSARHGQVKTGKTIPEILNEMGVVKEGQILEFMADTMGVKTIAVENISISQDLASILPKEICKSNRLIPIAKNGSILTVAMADPTDRMKVDALKFMTGLKIRTWAGTPSDILCKIEEIYTEKRAEMPAAREAGLIETTDSNLIDLEAEGAEDIATLFSDKKMPSAIRVVNALIADALEQEASDVHIEIKSRYVMVRYRISGLLSDIMHIPSELHAAIVSRIKVMGGLDIAERRRPQDGRITVKATGRLVDMRLSTLPTIAGEKVVFRILDRNASIKNIDELGMLDNQVRLVEQLAQKPQGCLLVTGPTGSGKTSTLYSLINKTATIHQNYTTIEDPVEYYMEKAEQVMIKEKIGLTFPVVLRTLLRQDPDTIMLGEIRDFETAEVAFHAALTGHTVMSTLHTNSCVATITRLKDMGIQPHIISSALNGIIAQRLVRRICPHCMVDDSVSDETKQLLGMDPTRPLPAKRGQGCGKCNQTGYMGRTGIYEVFNINHEIELMLQRGATEGELQKAAINHGMTLLINSGPGKNPNGDHHL